MALAILAGADAAPGEAGGSRAPAARAREGAAAPRKAAKPRRARRRARRPPVLPPDIRRGAHVGLVTSDDALVAQGARGGGAARRAPARAPSPDDSQTLGDLVWGCELVIVGRDARDDETAQRVLRSARDVLELA